MESICRNSERRRVLGHHCTGTPCRSQSDHTGVRNAVLARYLDASLLTLVRSRGSPRKCQRAVYQVGNIQGGRHEHDHHDS